MIDGDLQAGFNRGNRSDLSFFRDSRGLKGDLLFETGEGIGAIEIKSGSTIASDWFDALTRVGRLLPQVNARAVVYSGARSESRGSGEVVSHTDLTDLLERFERTDGI